MKILVATKESQGWRRNDFSHATPGELVTFGIDCHGETTDGPCGCRRSVVGIDTRKGTTSFKVVHSDLTEGELCQALKISHLKAEMALPQRMLMGEAIALRDIAAKFEAGTILERRGDHIQART